MFAGFDISDRERDLVRYFREDLVNILGDGEITFARNARVPDAILHALGGRNWLTPGLARGDVQSLGFVAAGLLTAMMGRISASARSLLIVSSVTTNCLCRIERAAHWVEPIASGRVRAAFCLSEPGTGSDAYAIACEARRDGAGFVVNGIKDWITNGRDAGVLLLFARMDGDICVFAVPGETAGLSRIPIDDMVGQRACGLARLVFDDCRLEERDLVCPPGFRGRVALERALDLGRFLVAWGALGLIKGSLEFALQRGEERFQFGVPLKDHQLIRRRISDIFADYQASGALCLSMSRLRDRNDLSAQDVTRAAKYFVADAAERCTRSAAAIWGASGLRTSSPLRQMHEDALILQMIEGSSEMMQVALADSAYSINRAG